MKHPTSKFYNNRSLVAPFVGAGLETVDKWLRIFLGGKSLISKERGLKLQQLQCGPAVI